MRELIEDLHIYFEQKEEKDHEEELLLSRLKGELPYFPITFLSRDDLTSRGFKGEDVDDCTMKEIASKMGSAYCDNGYWVDLDILAEDRAEKFRCPKCWKEANESDGKRCYCSNCSHDWNETEPTGRYVKVEYPEDSSFFETNEIGFDCYNSDDNGAKYIPEHLYIAHFDKKPKKIQIYEPIEWPESQEMMEWEHTAPKKFAQCELINPASGFDGNAYFVPLKLINTL